MYELIENQFKSGKALTQGKYYSIIKRDLWPKFYWDMYPLAQEYYHELNPYFLFNIFTPELYKFAKVFTVRDGYLNFADYMLKHVSTFNKLGVGCFLIHPSLAKLIPSHLTQYFASWQIVQKNQISMADAKKMIIFGIVSEQYLGEDIDHLRARLAPLKKLRKDLPIDLYLPLRKNVFESQGKDSILIHQVVELMKDILPDNKLRFITGETFFNITDFKNNYIYDLGLDNFIVSDSYFHYYCQSRGATINKDFPTVAPKDSFFSLDLSIHHELHICPLPAVQSQFAELLFYKKKKPMVKELIFDPGFQNLLRGMFNTKA